MAGRGEGSPETNEQIQYKRKGKARMVKEEELKKKKVMKDSSPHQPKVNRNHPFLKFESTSKAKERYATLSKLNFGIEKYLTISLLEDLRENGPFLLVIAECGLWKVFLMDTKFYVEPLLELLATFAVDWRQGENGFVSFRVGHQERETSLNHFAIACGVYEEGATDYGIDPRTLEFDKDGF